MSDPRDIVLLGSTGSIGTQALDVVRRNPHRFRVVGLAAGGGNLDLLARQAAEFSVDVVAVADEDLAEPLAAAIHAHAPAHPWRHHRHTKVLAGPDAAAEVAGWPCNVVLNGLTGSVGLLPTLRALEAGRLLALANKESLIVGGPLVRELAAPGQIVPVDSEHSALAQCLRAGRRDEVRRLVLTASGGPFRGRTRDELGGVTPEEALAHPTWAMGPLVTVNSATLMNKGLELIEAHLLFDLPLDRIDVVVHPQSVVHSMVEFRDGSTIAQASPPDMRLPIALGLDWPRRVPGAAPGCDWTTAATWEFLPLDEDAFPAVSLARRAGLADGTAPAVFNAADEECVAAFLEERLPFLGIVDTVAKVLDEHLAGGDGRPGSSHVPTTVGSHGNRPTLEDVLSAEAWARVRAREVTGLVPVAAGEAG